MVVRNAVTEMWPLFYLHKNKLFRNRAIRMGMQQDMDHTTPNKDELKLIIDNALLEQEKRITKSLNDSLSDQNKMYMDNILSLTDRVSKVEGRQDRQDERLKGMKGVIATTSAASAVLSGLIGFFIGQISGK